MKAVASLLNALLFSSEILPAQLPGTGRDISARETWATGPPAH